MVRTPRVFCNDADRLVGLVIKASTSRAAGLGFDFRLSRGKFLPLTKKMAPKWLLCQVPEVIGSALGLDLHLVFVDQEKAFD